MALNNGRAQLAVWAFGALAASAIVPGAAAQDGEEVIVDPELQGGSGAAPADTSAPDGDEVISDPELGGSAPSAPAGADYGWGAVYQEGSRQPRAPEQAAAEAEPQEEYDPLANTGLARLELLGQVAADLRHEGDLEDAYESRFRFGGEVELRRSRRLRVMLGSRIDFFWALPSHNDNVIEERHESVFDEDRFEVDVFATAAYVDVTAIDGMHLRLGQQIVSLARMDFYSPTDMLAAFDMRPQPRLDLAANKLAQPAVRLDWDLNSWATLQAIYVPWFSPHLSRPSRDRYVGAIVGGTGTGDLPPNLRRLIDPSQQTKASEASLRFIAPPPDFTTPQAQLRANFRGNAMEIALNGGTAVEKLPAVYITPTLNDYLINPYNEELGSAVAQALYAGQTVVDVQYHRYYQLGFDGSFDVSPFSIGFEFAYSPSRHLYAATSDSKHLPLPNVSQQITDLEYVRNNDGTWTAEPSNVTKRSIRRGVPLVQGALHVEWLKGESFALVGEAFWMNALALPHDNSRDWWGFIPKTGAFVGGMLAASYIVNDGDLRFDMTAVTLVGPSVILVPHVEIKAREGFYIDAGAQIFEGPAPGLNGAQNLNIGGLLSGYDQVFLGLRWLP